VLTFSGSLSIFDAAVGAIHCTSLGLFPRHLNRPRPRVEEAWKKKQFGV
jgi:hypothetical protein